MTRKILSFLVTFLFLAGAVWFINSRQINLKFGSDGTAGADSPDRVVKEFSFEKPPTMIINSEKSYEAEIDTTKGVMKFELFSKETPKTVNNFVFLAKEGFYENTFFHRVIKSFMIQGGDPKGDGTGSPGYKFNDEPITRDYERGVIAMANSGANTNGSQFFIMHEKNDLQKNYVIFGKITEGLDVLDNIASVPVVNNGSGEESLPLEKVYINKITISGK